MRLLSGHPSNSWSPASPSSGGVAVPTTAHPPSSAPPQVTISRNEKSQVVMAAAVVGDVTAPVSISGCSQHGDAGGDDDEEGALPEESDAAVEDEEDLGDETETDTAGALDAHSRSDSMGPLHRAAVDAPSTSGYGRGRSVRRGSTSVQAEGVPSATGWPPTPWSPNGPNRRDSSTNAYWQCLVPHILAPNAENNYYLAALRNAFNTLNEYAQFIGVDGSEFLKHLFSYYILGPRLTNDIIARLTPPPAEESITVGGSVSASSARPNRKHTSQQPYAVDDPPVKKRRLRRRDMPQVDSPAEPVPSTLSVDLGFASPAATTPTTSMVTLLRSGTPRALDREGDGRARRQYSMPDLDHDDGLDETYNQASEEDGASGLPKATNSVRHGQEENDDLSDITESAGVRSNLSDLSSSSEDDEDHPSVNVPKKFQREAVVSAPVLTPQKYVIGLQLRNQLEQRLAYRQACIRKLQATHGSPYPESSRSTMQVLIDKLDRQVRTLRSMCVDKAIDVSDILRRYHLHHAYGRPQCS